MLLGRSLPLIIAIGLIAFCLVECLTASGSSVRHLPKPVWIMMIVFVPVVGALAWLLFGRPHHPHQRRAGGQRGSHHHHPHLPHFRRHPIGPDDDPDFLKELGRRAAERRRDEDGDAGARA